MASASLPSRGLNAQHGLVSRVAVQKWRSPGGQYMYHHHQKAFRNKFHTSHGQRPGGTKIKHKQKRKEKKSI